MSGIKRISANSRAVAGSAKFIAYGIISLVVLYSDIMFISLLWKAFPGGFLTIVAVGGAFATGLSVIALVIGKSHWFRPGGQLLWAWCFTFVEVFVSMMNVIVSVLSAMGQPLGYLNLWIFLAPATPIVAMVGWILILYMDTSRVQLHEEMEMEDDLASAEREHKRLVHQTRMELKRDALAQQKEYLKQHLAAPEVQSALSQGSYEIARSIVSEIIEKPIMPALPSPQKETYEQSTEAFMMQQFRDHPEEFWANIQKIQGGGQTDQLPLSQMTSTGPTTKRQPSARKGPANLEEKEPMKK